MQKGTKLILAVFCLLIMEFFVAPAGWAQKLRKKRKIISEKEQVQAEYYFVEGEKYFILNDFSKANSFFQKSLSFNPDNATTHYKLAETYFKVGELDKALRHASTALSISPSNKYFYLLAADIYTKRSEFKQAAHLYELMLKEIPGTEEYLFELAALYLYQEDYKSALEAYDKAEAHFGINEKITIQKQKVYLKINKVEKALEEGDALIEAFPGESMYVLRQAEILISNDRGDEAVTYLTGLLAENANPYAHLMLAEVYSEQNKQALAEEHLVQAYKDPDLEITPKLKTLNQYLAKLPDPQAETMCMRLAEAIEQTHPDDFNTFALYGDLLLTLDKKTEAREKYLRAIELDASNYSVWQNILSIEMELSFFDEVIDHSDQALELFPNQAALYYFNGSANLIKKDYNRAIRALEQGKRMTGSKPEMLSVFNSQLGDAYNGLKQYDKSDKAYDEALKADANNFHVLNNYSYFLSLRGDKLEKALEMSSLLVKENPDNPTFLDTHAWVLYSLERYEEARKIMERALQGKVSSTILEHYGDILFKLGDQAEAVEQWKKAKQLSEGSTNVLDKKIADKKLYD